MSTCSLVALVRRLVRVYDLKYFNVLRQTRQHISSMADGERIVFNEANIPMINRRLQKKIFKKLVDSYEGEIPKGLAAEFKLHKIDIQKSDPSASKSKEHSISFDLPNLEGDSIEEHFRLIAEKQCFEYISRADELLGWSAPKRPKEWTFHEGWTRYNADGSCRLVECPEEDSIIFDVEVVVKEGSRPSLAIALTPEAWYSWTSPTLVRVAEGHSLPGGVQEAKLDDLVPIYESRAESRRIAKCVVGHFVSFDRARIRDEYSLEGTRARFLDTMGLHVAICGMTGTQRSLKLRADKRRFKNKVWREFLEDRQRFNRTTHEMEMMEEEEEQDEAAMMVAEMRDRPQSSRPSVEEDAIKMLVGWKRKQFSYQYASMHWLSESSLDNLLDVYRHHCGKEPPSSKDPRNIFVNGTSVDIVADFQNLMTYCANDVFMTHEVFKSVWPSFKTRFPHPVSMAGTLEMSTAFLPVNENWMRYQKKANDSYQNIRNEQKNILMKLADGALDRMENEKFRDDPWLWDLDWSTTKRTKSNESYCDLPKWYRDLLKKPMKENAHKGPVNVTLQTRVTPKLLRLSWNGLPLHYDNVLKWGYLMPGRDPSADKDPTYYDKGGKLRSRIEVVRIGSGQEPSQTPLLFPYGAIVEIWSQRLKSKLNELRDNLGESDKDKNISWLSYNDVRLMDELRRSCEALPLEDDEWERLDASFRAIEVLMNAEDELLKASNSESLTSKQITQLIADLQLRGAEFWQDENRYQKKSGVTKESENPFIPTCWFCHLPHKEGMGKPVGNPLSKPFMRSIADGQLRSEYGEDADNLLRSQIHCSYWQSSAKRIKEQICVWLKDDDSTGLYNPVTQTHRVGLILPQVKTIGTVTRRAVEKTWLTASNAYHDRLGSELKAMVQAPPGYRFVGADVDSQELWIASTLGDATVGIQGGTPFGWMVLQGSKKEGTDLHTVTSTMIGISRDSAKVLNYARLYGAGQAYSAQLLQQFNPGISSSDAREMARRLMEQTKGRRNKMANKMTWKGGTESATFNRLEEIALQARPKTPVLGAQLTVALNPNVVGKDFMTSRVNWVVQSSAVDYLHCMLVCMRWLCDEFDIPARFSISIHDEVRYLVKEPSTDRAALALQITNLLTRALFVYKLGMNDLPQSVAFFSGVDVDYCMRKEPTDDCFTPSNKEGLTRNYGLPLGESLDMAEVLRRTDGKLRAPTSDSRRQDIDRMGGEK